MPVSKEQVEKAKEGLEDLRVTINHKYCGDKEYQQCLAITIALQIIEEYENMEKSDLPWTRGFEEGVREGFKERQKLQADNERLKKALNFIKKHGAYIQGRDCRDIASQTLQRKEVK